ncbi:MAG TPA: DNA primase noncatalytic subunit PriX [Candidatus Nitrosocosmicus sp.]|nr:DNA primase noncatalytic subunit PriX [Candidatus Nitrosocosmicus sp.]
MGVKILNTIDFILSHFQSPLREFPRKMMTYRSNGQFTVTSKEEIFKRCEQDDFKDCRINAYPEVIENNGFLIQPPNFVFIDLDLSNFSNDIKKLDKVKNSTLRKMEQLNGSHPTVSFTGNGYHIYLPIEVPVLDNEYEFSKDKFPNFFSAKSKYTNYYVSEVFMQFAEDFFTGNKADPNHRPKYKTCLVRFPDTYNSKCLNKGLSKEESKVKILQKWNGKRINVAPITHDFRIWLTQLEINLLKNKKPKSILRKSDIKYSASKKIKTNEPHKIDWIEKLLQTPIEDYRKECLWRIIGPYLLNVKNLSELQASKMMEDWLNKCNKVRGLDFEPRMKIYSIIKGNKGYRPISLSKLKEEDSNLFKILTAQ